MKAERGVKGKIFKRKFKVNVEKKIDILEGILNSLWKEFKKIKISKDSSLIFILLVDEKGLAD